MGGSSFRRGFALLGRYGLYAFNLADHIPRAYSTSCTIEPLERAAMVEGGRLRESLSTP